MSTSSPSREYTTWPQPRAQYGHTDSVTLRPAIREPACIVSFDTAEGRIPQSAALPTSGSSRMRSKTRGRWCSLRLAIQHEYLERAIRVEHDLAVVADHLPAGELLDRARRLLAHHLLEAKPVAAHHVGFAGVEERQLVLGQAPLEHDEHEGVVDERLGLRRPLAIQVLLDPDHRVRDLLEQLAPGYRRLVGIAHIRQVTCSPLPSVVRPATVPAARQLAWVPQGKRFGSATASRIVRGPSPLSGVFPMSTKSFAQLGVSNAVVSALSKRGFTEPFAIQNLVIGDVLAGRDVLAKSPTGSGKTLAFAVPLSDRIAAEDQRPACLVLAPTRELASQIVEEWRPIAHARALRVAAVYGGVGIEKRAREAKKAHIVVASPGRLEDLIARRAISLKRVRVLVLDEADRMLDMGFRPAIDRLVAQCPAERQTLFFSATLDGEAGRIASEYTRRDAVRHEHVAPKEDIADISHRFVRVERDQRIRRLVSELRAERERALVFVRTKRGADRLVKRLTSAGVDAVAMHGDKSQRQRERALARFEAGTTTTLVATDVAARGIDVDRISHVINFDAPAARDTYVHRIGRTGRAGRTGVGITFVERENHRDMRRIARALELDREFAQSA